MLSFMLSTNSKYFIIKQKIFSQVGYLREFFAAELCARSLKSEFFPVLSEFDWILDAASLVIGSLDMNLSPPIRLIK